MTPEQFCEKYKLTLDQFYGNTHIKDNLYLGFIKELPEGFIPSVGGNLSLFFT